MPTTLEAQRAQPKNGSDGSCAEAVERRDEPIHRPATATSSAKLARRRGTKRVLFLGLVLVAVVTASYVLPVRSWLQHAGWLRQEVLSLGDWAYPAATLVLAVLIACGVPRLLLCTVAGMVLGLWPGLLVGEAGTVLSYYGLFLFVRWGGRAWAMRRWPKLRKWSAAIREHGIVAVILLRQLPIHGTLINVGLGLSRVKHRQFLIGTALGIIPELIPAVLVGTGLGERSGKSMAGYMSIGAIAFGIIWVVCMYTLRMMRRNHSADGLLADEISSNDTEVIQPSLNS